MVQRYPERFARYNAWANARLYDACANLSGAEYRGERPSFFGSIHNTLNHLLVVDRIWLGRIEGDPPAGLRLDTELESDFEALWAVRRQEDERIIRLVDSLGPAGVEKVVRYDSSSGVREDTVGGVLQHLFNHQTHHRGQVHDMLSQTGVAPPALDLLYYRREREEA